MATQHIKTQLILSAINVYSKNGVANTKLKQIAMGADAEPSHLKYHFPKANDLLIAVFQYLLEDLKKWSLKAIEKGKGSPRKSLHFYLGAPIDWAQKKKSYFSLWMYFYHMSAHNKSVRQINNEIRTVGRDRIRLLIYDVIQKEKLSPELPVAEIATMVQAHITGFTVLMGTEDHISATEAKRGLIQSVDQLLT